MQRVSLGAGLALELGAFALAGVGLKYGRFDQGVAFFLLLSLAVGAGAGLLARVLPARALGRVVVHGALLLGCAVFSFPFVWLVGTSFKYEEEIFVYPPRWVPAIPSCPLRSPYITAENAEPARRPEEVERQRWASLRPRLEEAVWEKGQGLLGPGRLADLDEEELRMALGQDLLGLACRGVAKQVWHRPDPQVAEAVAGRVDSALVEVAWSAVFRGLALRDLVVKDIRQVEYTLGEGDGASEVWTPIEGQVRLVRRPGEGTRPPLTVEYDLTANPRAVVQAVLPLPVSPEEFLSLSLPMRQDRSWHRLGLVLELDGRRYVPADPLYLDQRRWQELGFKIADRDVRDERELGIWPLVLAPDQSGVFAEPGRFRLTLAVERASPLAALWRKYTSNYRSAYIATPHRWSYVFNSGYLAVLTILGQLFSCSLVAYGFARLRWPGRDALFGVLLATMMLPHQVTMIPVFLIFKSLGWYNTLKTLWVPSFLGSAFFIFMLRQFMKGIPTDLEDAAKIDGCSLLGIYWRIVLPLVKPALAAVAIFTFMGTWNDFMGPLIYINDQRLYPLALGLFDFRTLHGGDFGLLMAASTLMTLPVVAIFFLAQKYFIQGVTLTGMKG